MLKENHRTEIVVDGQHRRLIDEVDIITGMSGGGFTALAYALYGQRLFSEYVQRFLKRDVQGELIRRAANPFNGWKFVGGTAGRSEPPPRTTTRSCSKARRTPTCRLAAFVPGLCATSIPTHAEFPGDPAAEAETAAAQVLRGRERALARPRRAGAGPRAPGGRG